MTLEQFQSHMGRLIDQFGKGAYSQGRVELVWREVRGLDVGWWERTVDRFIGEERQAPLLPQFRVAAASEKERAYQLEKQRWESNREAADWKPMIGCRVCAGNGVLFARERHRAGLTAFRCFCENGARDSRRFPQWKDDYRTQYIVDGLSYADVIEVKPVAVTQLALEAAKPMPGATP